MLAEKILAKKILAKQMLAEEMLAEEMLPKKMLVKKTLAKPISLKIYPKIVRSSLIMILQRQLITGESCTQILQSEITGDEVICT